MPNNQVKPGVSLMHKKIKDKTCNLYSSSLTVYLNIEIKRERNKETGRKIKKWRETARKRDRDKRKRLTLVLILICENNRKSNNIMQCVH